MDGYVSRVDGLILVIGLIALMIFLVVDGRRHIKQSGMASGSRDLEPEDSPLNGDDLPGLKKIAYLIGGMAGLAFGARLMVMSAVEIATILNIHPVVIGLTIVAIGTSLPELAASVVCAIKEESDMSVGNVLGSNMLNILFVVGVISLINPMTVEKVTITQHLPVMLGFALVLYPLARFRRDLSKLEGSFLLLAFATYLGWLTWPYL